MKKEMKLFVFIMLTFIFILNCEAMPRHCVILLHGLGRTHDSMSSVETILKQRNYFVVNKDYPSTEKSIEQIANQCIAPMIDQCLMSDTDQINFVTHSMGGIILRKYLQDHKIPHLFRIVMLAPPNHGSKLADALHNTAIFKFFTGPAGQELTTDKTSLTNALPQLNAKYQIGIIAGNVNQMPFNHFIFHEANDGKVAVSSTKLDNMKDFIILAAGHSYIMDNYFVQWQIINFLKYGRFIH